MVVAGQLPQPRTRDQQHVRPFEEVGDEAVLQPRLQRQRELDPELVGDVLAVMRDLAGSTWRITS
ncbi:hypothetical protein [Nonomuraea longispora]|uniref:hypothetical protein n=1 Tax=Nonomuraea longispora TaxID=1848320 RepID=UPI001FE31622|nr:hypothetical protein [Nonomuraea longispora]